MMKCVHVCEVSLELISGPDLSREYQKLYREHINFHNNKRDEENKQKLQQHGFTTF